MTDTFPRARTAIAGLATFGIGETPGYSSMELTAQAALLAVADAGLTLADVDALFICQPDDFFAGLSFAEYLGLQPRYTDNNRTGGSAFMSHMAVAAMMLEAGYIDCALIAYGSNQRSNGGKLATKITNNQWDAPYAPIFPLTGYALAAARHMHEYGTTREDLAAVALAARAWAQTNPEAFAKGPLSLEECLAARMISTPISVRDCCLVTDGAAAIVMTRTSRARDLAKPAVPLLGAAAATWWNSIAQAKDVTVTAARESGARAMAMAGVSPSDIRTAQLYDAFTINTILFLEDLGFCPKGEGGRFVSSGAIAPGGSLPVNTNGGGLSCCHPGMYGLFAVIEAARQIRGEAANQLSGVDVALAHGNGGTLSSQATVVLGSLATL
ncbi:acetyl-CoA acetyltransferase [Novosphingobium resinovorum]|uniref:acetyl-CoA acetyltransferase n=1 Tax=Novosphingobium TaxID=165696 RepID=UPI001B3C639B|nr:MULTISPECIES: acetyl-CoA acetyltransferase [Novosphingobium]MBF7014925.1 thiolase [Novosphingobium sp. HR1a]WJM24598.1 acetyl-CoA acetyltransferase [Novosphingobium resinovorum]